MKDNEESAWIKYVFGVESENDRKVIEDIERRLKTWEKRLGITSYAKDVKKNANKKNT